jgi:putative transposase
MGLKKQFNAIKGEQFPFVGEVLRDAANDGFTKLGKAFSTFFASRVPSASGLSIGMR